MGRGLRPIFLLGRPPGTTTRWKGFLRRGLGPVLFLGRAGLPRRTLFTRWFTGRWWAAWRRSFGFLAVGRRWWRTGGVAAFLCPWWAAVRLGAGLLGRNLDGRKQDKKAGLSKHLPLPSLRDNRTDSRGCTYLEGHSQQQGGEQDDRPHGEPPGVNGSLRLWCCWAVTARVRLSGPRAPICTFSRTRSAGLRKRGPASHPLYPGHGGCGLRLAAAPDHPDAAAAPSARALCAWRA